MLQSRRCVSVYVAYLALLTLSACGMRSAEDAGTPPGTKGIANGNPTVPTGGPVAIDPNATTPTPPAGNVPAPQSVSDLQALQTIATNLATFSATDRPFQRYFTLEAWGNIVPTVPIVSADMERGALFKMINLVSTGPTIVLPVAIDAASLIYRVDMRDLKWTAAAWTNMKATDVYFLPASFPKAMAAAANQTMRGDWFVANIPNSTVNAYFVFLGINTADPNIDALNNVDRFSDMAAGAPATVRVGLAVSGTEAHNRILSWHKTSALGSGSGHLFKSYNFDTDVADADIFSHPYRPTTNSPTAAGAFDFTYADSDNIFTLPNGLFGYYTVEGASAGQVMNEANAGAPFPGPTFCFQCHDNVTNMIGLSDQMHAAITSTKPGTFPASLQTLLLGMYDASAMATKLTDAGTTFARSYASLKMPVAETAGVNTESTNIVANTYAVVLKVDMAAAEMGVTPDALVKAIKASASLSLQLSSLTTEDANNVLNGVIRRDTWEVSYAAVRTALFP